jgi:hypothetical protein
MGGRAGTTGKESRREKNRQRPKREGEKERKRDGLRKVKSGISWGMKDECER